MNDLFMGMILGGFLGFSLAMALTSVGILDPHKNSASSIKTETLVLSSDSPISIHPLKKEEFYLIRDSK